MAKGTKFNAKQFFVNHGEKFALGLVVLVVLYALATANWIPYKGDPRAIVEAAEQAQAQYDARAITPDEAKELGLVVEEDQRPAALVQKNILEDWSAGRWDLRVPLAVSPTDGKQPFKDAQDLFERHPIRKLTASTYWVLLNLGPEDPPPAAGVEAKPGDEASPPPTTLAGGPRGNVPNLDEEFQRKSGAASGAGLGPGGCPTCPAGAGYMETYYSPELDYYEGSMGEGGGEMSFAGTKLKGRGQFFISVRGIIPLHELIRDVAESRNCDFAEAATFFQLIDYHLERQMLKDDGSWPADDQWESVDRETALSILQEVDGFDLDPVPPPLTDPAVTMPLPARITGVWGRHATHPDIETFSLSQQDMENEMKFQRALLTKAQEMQAAQQIPQEAMLVKPRGFSDVMMSSRTLQSEVMGMESSYGSTYEDYSAGGMENTYGTMGGQQTQQNDPKFAALVKELTEKVVDKKATDKKLEEYIKSRITAVGNLLLFRYVDFAVEPGKTYRYRARLEVENPNYQARVQDAEAPSVVEGETRFNAWSNITDPVSVERTTYYFVHNIDWRRNDVEIDFFHRDSQLGTMVSNAEPDPPEEDNKNSYPRLKVGFGEPVGGNMEVWELSPGGYTFKKDDIDGTKEEQDGDNDPKGYSFQSGDLLVAALDDYDLNRSEHPDLQIPRAQINDLQLVDAILIQGKDGKLTQLDSITQQPWLEYMQRTIEKQNEPFRDLKSSGAATADGLCPCLADLYGSGEYMSEMMSADGGARRADKRTRSVLRKSGSRADANTRGRFATPP
ncbi:MAG: hypothetical protein ACK5Q5_14735 [Planctomycetaceae bacterium]